MTPLKKRISRVTQTPLDGTFCRDRRRRIVVSLVPGDGKEIPDLLELRPEKTRRTERIAVADVYRYAVRARANRELLEKARARKEKKAKARATRRLDAAERRKRKEWRELSLTDDSK